MPTKHGNSEPLGFDLLREIDLITRAYCEINGLPVPQKGLSYPQQEVEPYKEKVKKELGL